MVFEEITLTYVVVRVKLIAFLQKNDPSSLS